MTARKKHAEPDGPHVDENNVPQPFAPVNLSDPQAPVHEPVVVSAPEPSPPSSESSTNPAADPVVPVVSEALPDEVGKDFAKAEKLVLDGCRALLAIGHTRAQLLDACKIVVEKLYVERADALAAGNDDPYPTY